MEDSQVCAVLAAVNISTHIYPKFTHIIIIVNVRPEIVYIYTHMYIIINSYPGLFCSCGHHFLHRKLLFT